MAKETKAQQKTVERVMHEFKEGALKSGSGDKVKSRKQAIAIGLNEAGASNRQSASGKRGAERTKAELYAEAKKRDVAGRSTMSKMELERAVRG